jgi:hypothetical protein
LAPEFTYNNALGYSFFVARGGGGANPSPLNFIYFLIFTTLSLSHSGSPALGYSLCFQFLQRWRLHRYDRRIGSRFQCYDGKCVSIFVIFEKNKIGNFLELKCYCYFFSKSLYFVSKSHLFFANFF